MATRKPDLILQLQPEDTTSDSEYACILKYGGLQAWDTCRKRIEQQGIPDDLDPEDYSAIIVGGSFSVNTQVITFTIIEHDSITIHDAVDDLFGPALFLGEVGSVAVNCESQYSKTDKFNYSGHEAAPPNW